MIEWTVLVGLLSMVAEPDTSPPEQSHEIFLSIVTSTIAFLAVPTVGTALAWLANSFSPINRLMRRIRKAAELYATLPESRGKTEYKEHIDELVAMLAERVQPRLKTTRVAHLATTVAAVVLAVVYVGTWALVIFAATASLPGAWRIVPVVVFSVIAIVISYLWFVPTRNMGDDVNTFRRLRAVTNYWKK
jgi:hypothetical protein